MCVLAVKYPIARDCFIEHGAIQQIEALSTTEVTLPKDAPTQPGEAAAEISILRSRCLTVLNGGSDEVFQLWESFHLAGDDVAREKIPNMMLSYMRQVHSHRIAKNGLMRTIYDISNKSLSFVAARLLASIMRRPEARRDLSEDFWEDYLGFLKRELDSRSRYTAGFDCEAMDELLLASMDRVSHFLGQYSSEFSGDDSTLVALASKLQRYVEPVLQGSADIEALLVEMMCSAHCIRNLPPLPPLSCCRRIIGSASGVIRFDDEESFADVRSAQRIRSTLITQSCGDTQTHVCNSRARKFWTLWDVVVMHFRFRTLCLNSLFRLMDFSYERYSIL